MTIRRIRWEYDEISRGYIGETECFQYKEVVSGYVLVVLLPGRVYTISGLRSAEDCRRTAEDMIIHFLKPFLQDDIDLPKETKVDKKYLLCFINSLTTCENLGDLADAIQGCLTDIGERWQWNDLHDLRDKLEKRGIGELI